MVTDENITSTGGMVHVGNTMKMYRIFDHITVYERIQQLEKEVAQLKKELSNCYLTRGRREFLKKGSY